MHQFGHQADEVRRRKRRPALRVAKGALPELEGVSERAGGTIRVVAPKAITDEDQTIFVR